MNTDKQTVFPNNPPRLPQQELEFAKTIYTRYRRCEPTLTFDGFLSAHAAKISIQPLEADKAAQIASLLKVVDIEPVDNEQFYLACNTGRILIYMFAS